VFFLDDLKLLKENLDFSWDFTQIYSFASVEADKDDKYRTRYGRVIRRPKRL